MRHCSRCGESKPDEDFYRRKATGKAYGFCKPCQSSYAKAWRAGKRDDLNAKRRDAYAENRDAWADRSKRYRDKNPERHRELSRERSRRYDERHPGRRSEIGKSYRARLRDEVFAAYGGYVCSCCGEREPKFLTLDHINNDGHAHRRELFGHRTGGPTSVLLRWLKANRFPPVLQVLCMNCNFGKHINKGVCPHKTSEGSTTIP